MLGWILNATTPEESLLLDRVDQQPLYYSEGVPVFEVWFWHRELRKWFVMIADPIRLAKQDAIGFHPLCGRGRLLRLIDQWRAYLGR
jgi:hypothetical protein